MSLWLGLVAGLIIGWVIEWIIDWRFWRRSTYSSLEAEHRLRTELAAAQNEIRQLQNQLAELTWPAKEAIAQLVQRDPLEQINGIGPVFAQRLHDAGIFRFAELAAATPETIRLAVQPEAWQRVDAEQWIARAAELAEQQPAAL
jgi:predicted flap endonuclease-1-like 5' DNA nuclease